MIEDVEKQAYSDFKCRSIQLSTEKVGTKFFVLDGQWHSEIVICQMVTKVLGSLRLTKSGICLGIIVVLLAMFGEHQAHYLSSWIGESCMVEVIPNATTRWSILRVEELDVNIAVLGIVINHYCRSRGV